LFPVIKRQNEAVALGYVAGRVVEAVVIFVGIISLLSVVTLRQDFAGAGAPARNATGATRPPSWTQPWPPGRGTLTCPRYSGLAVASLTGAR
jgi:hypothetical protein